MELKSLFCTHCGKKFIYEPADPPQFCLYCGRRIIIPDEEPVSRTQACRDSDSVRNMGSSADGTRKTESFAEDTRNMGASADGTRKTESFADGTRNMDSSADGTRNMGSSADGTQKTDSSADGTRNTNPSAAASHSSNGIMEFAPEEYKGAKDNTDFINANNERIMTGWLPEGCTSSADQKVNEGDMDCPLALWARAMLPSGREWFCRRLKKIKINKNDRNQKNSFLPYDEYLDTKAASLLGASPHLILRVPAPEHEMEQIRETLKKRKQDLLALSKGDFLQCIVQGEYSALGGKLYEATVGGKPKYLFLYVFMIADEFGYYSKQLAFSKQQIENSARTIQQLVTGSFGGTFGGALGGLFGRQQPTEEPVAQQIDTDPNTPFGMHRTDGLCQSWIVWNIITYAGFLSDTLPERDEIRDFLRFVYSLKTSPEMQKAINRFQEQAVNQNAMMRQQMTNMIQQGTRQRQQQMERHNAVMNGIRADMDDITSRRISSANAAFDRSLRKSHEMAMGVDTYSRTDGTTAEASVGVDKVFQNENDPSLLFGAPNAMDAPIGWTELDKLD